MSIASRTLAHSGASSTMPTLDDYFAALVDGNPFAVNRINEPSAYDVDVPSIHGAGFERLLKLARQAHGQPSGVGAVLLGGAGVGKSHLLSRLFRWANAPATGGQPQACYVYLHNVLADPDRLPRFLLKRVVSLLSRGGNGPLHETPLYRLVDRAIRHAARNAGIQAELGESTIKAHFAAYLDCYASAPGNVEIYRMLLRFWRFSRPEKAHQPGRGNAAAAALAWLSGDELDAQQASGLEYQPAGRNLLALKDDQDIEHVLITIAHLAKIGGQPLILCVDQADNLDSDKLRSLARFLHALIDQCPNLLVVTSGVKETMLGFAASQVIPAAAWDRIAQYKVELGRIGPGEARQILEARLERFNEPFEEVDAVRLRFQEDTLFPLSRRWLERALGGAIDLRPRDVLSMAREAWEEQSAAVERGGGETWLKLWPQDPGGPEDNGSTRTDRPRSVQERIDDVVKQKIEERIAKHLRSPEGLPPDAGNLSGLVETLLRSCQSGDSASAIRSVDRMDKKAGRLPPYDLRVSQDRASDGKVFTIGIVFITNVPTSATKSLKRLLKDPSPPDRRVLVTDEERRPLEVGATGRSYYDELVRLGSDQFQHIKITFKEYAMLDALNEVLGLARSGDLEIEESSGAARPVTVDQVIASCQRQGYYLGHPVLKPLLTGETARPKSVSPETDRLEEMPLRQFIMAQLALRTCLGAKALIKEYLETRQIHKLTVESAWLQVKQIAGRMRDEGLLHAKPQDDDLFLTLRN